MKGLKQHRDFKRLYQVEAAEKIWNMRKIVAEQVKIAKHSTGKHWYWAMGLEDIP